MDYLRANAENVFSSTGRNPKHEATEQIKRHVFRPLLDVKNILSDKSCLPLNKNKKEITSEAYANHSESKEAEVYVDSLKYPDELEDDYRDIIPVDLQLNSEDIKSICSVFIPPSIEDDMDLPEFLPLPEVSSSIYLDNEDDFFLKLRNRFSISDGLFDVNVKCDIKAFN